MPLDLRRLALGAALAAAPAAASAGCAEDIAAYMQGDVYAAHNEAADAQARQVFRREIAIAKRFAATEKNDACYEVFASAQTVLADNRLARIIPGYGDGTGEALATPEPPVEGAVDPAGGADGMSGDGMAPQS